MNAEQIARVAHEVNRSYCQALGDNSQPAWEDAPEWQRTSAINGVEFHRANPDASPDHSHNAWLEEKRASGWKYGPTKNPETKEHPCFVPYDELPTEQKVKDYLFCGVVRALRNGYTVTGESACASPENFDAELGHEHPTATAAAGWARASQS